MPQITNVSCRYATKITDEYVICTKVSYIVADAAMRIMLRTINNYYIKIPTYLYHYYRIIINIFSVWNTDIKQCNAWSNVGCIPTNFLAKHVSAVWPTHITQIFKNDLILIP